MDNSLIIIIAAAVGLIVLLGLLLFLLKRRKNRGPAEPKQPKAPKAPKEKRGKQETKDRGRGRGRGRTIHTEQLTPEEDEFAQSFNNEVNSFADGGSMFETSPTPVMPVQQQPQPQVNGGSMFDQDNQIAMQAQMHQPIQTQPIGVIEEEVKTAASVLLQTLVHGISNNNITAITSVTKSPLLEECQDMAYILQHHGMLRNIQILSNTDFEVVKTLLDGDWEYIYVKSNLSYTDVIRKDKTIIGMKDAVFTKEFYLLVAHSILDQKRWFLSNINL